MPILGGILGAVLLLGILDFATTQLRENYDLTGPTAYLVFFLLIGGVPGLFYVARSNALRLHYNITRVFWLGGGIMSLIVSFILYWIGGGQSSNYLFFASIHAIPLVYWFMFLMDRGGFFAWAVPDSEAAPAERLAAAPSDRIEWDKPNAPAARCGACAHLFPHLAARALPASVPADDTPDWLKFDPERFKTGVHNAG